MIEPFASPDAERVAEKVPPSALRVIVLAAGVVMEIPVMPEGAEYGEFTVMVAVAEAVSAVSESVTVTVNEYVPAEEIAPLKVFTD